MPSIRDIGIVLVIATLVQASAGAAYAAERRPQTDRPSLDALALRLKAKFLAGRGAAYNQILKSTDPAQMALNASEDMELIYVDEGGRPHYYKTTNSTAAKTISTNLVFPGGSGGYSLTGSGTTLGKLAIWDAGGVLTTHQEFDGRVTQMDSPSGTHYHATHVAGTMVAGGFVPNAKGMSFEANLAAYDWSSDESEMASAASSGLNVSNHSYGYVTGWDQNGDWYWYGNLSISTTEDYSFGFYDSHTRDWDAIAYDAPYYTIVVSAGNDRNDNGPGAGNYHYHWNGGWVWDNDTHDVDGGTDRYDCLGSPHTAKNPIIVGAVNDIYSGYSDPSDVVITSFSSIGPTDDGRIKPDLVANGQGLYSTYNTGDNQYVTLSGTSMSAPNLSGSVNLLVRHYEETHSSTTPLSSSIKAVVIQTADEAGDYTGPDYKHGWGLMNTLKAADLIAEDESGPIRIHEDYLASGTGDTDTLFFYSTGTEPLRLTLAWTDPEGTPPSPSLNPTTPMLVNDLDLRVIYSAGPTTHSPWILDPSNPANAATTGDNTRDNVEQVYIASPAAGEYMAVVSHKGTLSSNQWFSLACSVPMDETGHDATPPTVAVTAPNGGETWTADLDYDITWVATDAHGVEYVDIYYSTNGGDTFSLVSSGETNDSLYTWTIPNTPTDSAVVKVVAFDPWTNQNEDISDSFFTILPPPDTTDPVVNVTSPNGGEVWYAGTTESITWSATDAGGVDSVSIYYSSNNGASFDLVSSQEPNDGTYDWLVPGVATDSALVKVVAYDPSLNVGEDVSDAVFTIVYDVIPPDVIVIYPNGGDTSYVGDTCSIRWVAYDPTFAIEDDFEDGTDDGWTHWCYNPTCSYTVSGGVYTLDSNPGASASVLDATAGWDDYTLMADLRNDTGTSTSLIFRFVDTDHYYKLVFRAARFTVTRHATISDTTLATVKTPTTLDTWNRVVVDVIGDNIKVSVNGVNQLDMIDPDPISAGQAGLWAETNQTVMFDNVVVGPVNSITSVDIDYSTDGGATFPYTIATGEINDLLYEWTVPNTPTANAMVRVTAYDQLSNSAADSSDTTFTIALFDTTDPTVTVTAPNGGETWYIGGTEDITWSASDANGVDSVSIYYSVNAGGNYDLIASQEANDGVFPWLVPATATTDGLVKVVAYDPNLNEGQDVSDAVFTIAEPPDTTDPTVTVTAPNGGESWPVGSTQTITWDATDDVGVDHIDLYYATDFSGAMVYSIASEAGGTFIPIATGEVNDGTFDWTIPDTPTDSAVVKVVASDTSGNTGEDVSDAVFTIAPPPDTIPPAVSVLTPDKADSLEIGTSYDITWAASDANGVDSVSIYYSTNGGNDYSLLASGETNDGIYPWIVPDTPTDSAMVKIVAFDPTLNQGQDESDSLNVIYQITLDVPGGRRHLGETVLLWQNRPNPFSPSTNISFYLPQEGQVSLEVFDAAGRRVSVVIDGRICGSGITTVAFDGRDQNGAKLSSGVYFYRLKAGGTVRTKKMVVAH